MAEDTVVIKEQLTDAMIEAGDELTRKLDQDGIRPHAAFWLFMPELNEWRLMFSMPEVSTPGSISVYKRIQAALRELGERVSAVPFSSIGLLEPKAEVVQTLGTALRRRSGARVRVSREAVGGRFIEDALIYRTA